MIELKFDVGVPSGKLKNPPKSCIPSSAKIKMNKKRRKSRDKMEDMAFIKAITRFLKEDQYLKEEMHSMKNWPNTENDGGGAGRQVSKGGPTQT